MTRKRLLIAVPLALVALLAVLALVGALSGARHEQNAAGSSAAGATSAELQRDAGSAPGEAAKGGAADQAAANGDSVYAAALPPTSSAPHYLLRTGDLQLLVARHGLQAAIQRISGVTTTMGGYILSSYAGTGTPPWIVYPEPVTGVDDAVKGAAEEPALQGDTPVSSDGAAVAPAVEDTSTRDGSLADGGGVPYGQITVRVPGERFDAALARFSALGRIEQTSTSSTDVSDQMVDLKARLRHARSVERRLLGFLEQAQTVQAALAVQDRLDQNQLLTEQLKGQLAQLSETTTYGTITVSLRERGVPQPGAIDRSDTFTGAFLHSLHLIADGARVSAVALGAFLPFAALLGGLAALVLYVRRRMVGRRPQRPQAIES
jgi:hypothetical protein